MVLQGTALEEHFSRATAAAELGTEPRESEETFVSNTQQSRKTNHCWVVLCACMHVLLYSYLLMFPLEENSRSAASQGLPAELLKTLASK